MKEINVTGQKRADLGKKASKELRKQGLIPLTSMVRRKAQTVLLRLLLLQLHSANFAKLFTLLTSTLSILTLKASITQLF